MAICEKDRVNNHDHEVGVYAYGLVCGVTACRWHCTYFEAREVVTRHRRVVMVHRSETVKGEIGTCLKQEQKSQ